MRSPLTLLLILVCLGVGTAFWLKRRPDQKAGQNQSARTEAVLEETSTAGPAPPFTGTSTAETATTEQLLQKQVESLQIQLEFLRNENAGLREVIQKQVPLPVPTLSPPALNRNLPPDAAMQ